MNCCTLLILEFVCLQGLQGERGPRGAKGIKGEMVSIATFKRNVLSFIKDN